MTTILLTAPYMIPYLDRFLPVLEHYGLEVIVPEVNERMSEAELRVYAGQVDGSICGDDAYTEDVLAHFAPRLKVLSKWGTGIDSIDRQAAARMGVRVCNTPNAFTLPVSDSVIGYMLAFARLLPWMDRAVKSGIWSKLLGRSLSECSLGVIGLGNIGKAVIRRARPFGMKLLGNDIIPIAPDFIIENGVEMTSLPELLSRSDFVSVNCDMNPTSYHLLNAETLSHLRPGAVIINTARGRIIDELALIAALQSGRAGGAALDVFEVEPLPADSPLRGMDQVMLAAHNSNSSPAAWERVHWNTIRNLLDGLGIEHGDLDSIR
ncbi:MAG TPA: phosphoglycerate dehydrogenase [Levilinea sp.]|nr:phosphoglycerate dehydrogenase [Levilinea sp.]